MIKKKIENHRFVRVPGSSGVISSNATPKDYYIHLIIRNLGILEPLEFNYSIYIDEETATNLIDESSITLSSYDIAGKYLYIDWFIPSKLIGLHTLIITIDSGNEIEESDEMDNRIEIVIQINWDYFPFLGYLFIFLGIGIAVVDIIIYQMKKGPHIARPSPENPTGGRP